MYTYRFQPLRAALSIFGALLLVVATSATITGRASAFADGDGSEETPYRIETCEDLQDMNNDLDAYYVLANDIDCSETATWNGGAGFEPIGQYDAPFLGELDGDSHVISGLFIDTTLSSGSPAGLFDRVGQNDNQIGLVKDVGLENIDVKGGWSTGGLVGVLYGQANNTYTTGSVEGSGEVGGLVGSHGGTWDTVIDSWSGATVVGSSDVIGGLVGYNAQDSQIINSYATGDVTGGDDYVGGLVGLNSGNIENSHATGDVSGYDDYVGGLVGEHEGTMTRSYATGFVSGNGGQIGGLVGRNDVGTITQSYSNNATGGENNVGVDGNCQVGGLVGYSSDGTLINNFSRSSIDASSSCGEGGLVGQLEDGSITYGYSTGQVNSDASGSKGGLIGYTDTSSVWSSFWDTDTTGLTDGCGTSSIGDCSGVDKVNGKTTTEMKTESPYVDPILSEGAWFFASIVGSENAIWEIDPAVNDGYPFFIATTGATPVDWPESEESDGQDLNGDEIPDIEQPNVGGYISPYTGKTVAIDVGENCQLTTDDLTTESLLAVQDAAYDYDNGLWDFEADCGTPGSTTTIKLYYYNVSPEGLVLRKHNPTTNAYFTISDAIIDTTTINGDNVTVVTYQVTDGGERDIDGLADGMINDPAGLAKSVLAAPNTGLKRL